MPSIVRRRFGAPFLARAATLATLGVALAACASGESDPDTSGGSLGGAGGGAGDASADRSADGDAATDAIPAGQPGATCATDADCEKGKCEPVGRKGTPRVCVVPCAPGSACPAGTACEWLGANGYGCVPDLGSQCGECTADDACLGVADRCLTAPAGDKFCARDCSFDGDCPAGFDCVDPVAYAAGDAGVPGDGGADAGASDATSDGASAGGDGGSSWPDAAADAAHEAGDAATDGGKRAARQCVPSHGLSCACDAARDGVQRACAKRNAAGSCSGHQKCDGASGAWSACDAREPAPEVCDGKDEDCDGVVDNGDPAQLCAGMTPPPHGTWACDNGKCVLGGCQKGYTNYPPGASGCTCAVDAAEPNDQCAKATSVGMVSNGGTSALTVGGTLSWATDVDWYTFDAADAVGATANTFHVHVGFASNPANEFVFDVIRGATCLSPAHDNGGQGLTEYDWCVDFGGANSQPGELTCGASTDGLNRCSDHSSTYFVRVWRKAGATPTCSGYTLTISGAGPGTSACDATSACDPQTP